MPLAHPSFSSACSLLLAAERNAEASRKPYLAEARDRLEQIDLFVAEFAAIKGVADRRIDFRKAMMQRSYAEAIYYFGHRAVKALAKGVLRWPAKPVLGMTIVRNHLIEHADRIGLLSQNWVTEVSEGIILKPFSPDQYRDRGLFPNLLELKERIERAVP